VFVCFLGWQTCTCIYIYIYLYTYKWLYMYIHVCMYTYTSVRHDKHQSESCHAYEPLSCHAHDRVMSHTHTNHDTLTNEPCYACVYLHLACNLLWTSHVTHTNASWRYTYEWSWPNENASCRISEWVMSHVRMGHVTRAYLQISRAT